MGQVIKFGLNQNELGQDQYVEQPISIFLSPCPAGVSLKKGHPEPHMIKPTKHE